MPYSTLLSPAFQQLSLPYTSSTLQPTSGDHPSLKYALQAIWHPPIGSILCFPYPNVHPNLLPCPNAFSHLGGEDFDNCLVNYVAQGFKRNEKKGKFNPLYS
jgi:hypothetical protein